MKKCLSIVVFFIFTSSFTIGQDTLSIKHEFGSVLFNRKYSSLVYGFPDSGLNTFFSGIFYRIHKNKWSIKWEMNFSESNSLVDEDSLCQDCYYGRSNNKVFEFSSGFQYKFNLKSNYIYSYADILYRNTSSIGEVTGGTTMLNDDFKLNSNGFGGGLGVGVSFVLFRQLRIGSEFGYYMCFSAIKLERVSHSNNLVNETLSIINSTMHTRVFMSVSF